MNESVEEHIAKRKEVAAEEMRHQGFFARMKSRAGLATANGIDRVTPTTTGNIVALAEGIVEGGIKGGTLGFVAGVIMVGLGASAAGGLIYSAMAIGAVAYGIIHAVKAVEEYRATGRHTLADRVAESSGAVSGGLSHGQEVAQRRQARAQYYQDEETIYGPPHYAQDENRRRANRENRPRHTGL